MSDERDQRARACRGFRSLIRIWMDGELDDRRAVAVRGHVEACRECIEFGGIALRMALATRTTFELRTEDPRVRFSPRTDRFSGALSRLAGSRRGDLFAVVRALLARRLLDRLDVGAIRRGRRAPLPTESVLVARARGILFDVEGLEGLDPWRLSVVERVLIDLSRAPIDSVRESHELFLAERVLRPAPPRFPDLEDPSARRRARRWANAVLARPLPDE